MIAGPRTVTQRERNALHSANPLKLGLFSSNCSSGRCLTTVPERWSASWDDNLRLAVLADAAGIEFMLPIGRWKGYGGITDHQGESLETITWATALLASTQRMTVFGTVHAPLFHPLIAAKQMVTADHVGQGRFGLNIVAGWNEDEFEMFGVAQRDHDGRYAYAQEWIDAIRAAWERDDFDVDGTYLHLKGVREKPKPFGGSRPIIMNAGQSPDGRAFAIRNSDAFFTIARLSTDLAPMIEEVRTVKAAAAALGREIDVFKTAFVTCRPTRAEAVEYHRYCVEENADWDAIETLMEGRGLMKLAEDERKLIRANYPKAVLGYALVGNPDDVARGLADVAAAGLAGIALAFVNYGAELPYVCAEVLPRLERMGLRS